MLSAGLAVQKALETLNRSLHQDNIKLGLVIRRVAKGVKLSSALSQAKLVSAYEFALLKTAEAAGKIEHGLEHISQRQLKNINHRRSMEAALLMPKAVLLIAAFVALFIKVVQDQQALFASLIEVSLLVLLVLVLTRLCLNLWSMDTRRWLGILWPSSLIRGNSKLFINRFELLFFKALQWQSNAGVAMDSALANLRYLLNNSLYQTNVDQAQAGLIAGQPLAKALIENHLVLSQRMRSVLEVAHATGTVDQSLDHELAILESRLDEQVKNQLRWWPKLYYVLVLVIMFAAI